ncbi:MAG: carbohydrate-binding family 9-like protein [Paludibacter sp.]|nr:carbohydrate-binding family 9-like protein [Paludibacter sp.]
MKTAKVKYFNELDKVTSVEQAASLLAKKHDYEWIDIVNWPTSFSLKPDCKFIIARSSTSIFIHYIVNEKQIKAVFTKDQDPVWQDSCVEFFCQIPGNKTYFNFEFNCIGTCLATERVSRTEDVNPLSPDKMSQIKRFASLGNEPFEEKKGDFDWTLTVEIPFSVIGVDADKLPELLKANFYKCGDETSAPHYVSWSPITIENPDFHRPEFFGELVM